MLSSELEEEGECSNWGDMGGGGTSWKGSTIGVVGLVVLMEVGRVWLCWRCKGRIEPTSLFHRPFVVTPTSTEFDFPADRLRSIKRATLRR